MDLRSFVLFGGLHKHVHIETNRPRSLRSLILVQIESPYTTPILVRHSKLGPNLPPCSEMDRNPIPFHPNFGGVPVGRDSRSMLGSIRAKILSYSLSRVIIFEVLYSNFHPMWSVITVPEPYRRTDDGRRTDRQDSWAIAKKTARCTQYMGALKRFQSLDYAPGYFSRNL